MKSLAIFVFLFVSGNCLANEQANNYIDNFLSTAFASQVNSLHIDQAIAPDFEMEFEEQSNLFGTVKGKADFKNGTVEGLDEARRLSGCDTRFEPRIRAKVVNCTIKFDKLKVKYQGKLEYGRMPKVNVKGKAKVKDTHFFVEIVQESPMQPIVRNFTCTQMGRTTEVEFSGLGDPLNRRMSSLMEEGYTKQVHAVLWSGGMKQELQYAINRALSTDVLPF